MFNIFRIQHPEEQIMQPTQETDAQKKEMIYAPIQGEAVPSTEISDLTFQKELLGKGIAIRPEEGKVFAPVDGKIEMFIDTMHAVSMTSANGAEILIHVGLDTVELKGKHFKGYVKKGDMVKRGDLMLEFDIAAITAAGYDVISPVIICNSDDYADVKRVIGKKVNVDEVIIKLEK